MSGAGESLGVSVCLRGLAGSVAVWMAGGCMQLRIDTSRRFRSRSHVGVKFGELCGFRDISVFVL